MIKIFDEKNGPIKLYPLPLLQTIKCSNFNLQWPIQGDQS